MRSSHITKRAVDRKVLQEHLRKEEFRRVRGGGWDEYICVSGLPPPYLSLLYQSTSLALAIR